jgi:hypothetical protein
MRRKIKNAVNDYTLEGVLKAIDNYAKVLQSPLHWFSYKWTLEDFLQRGLAKFVDEADPLNNFLDKPKKYVEPKKSPVTEQEDRLLTLEEIERLHCELELGMDNE